MLNRVCYRLRIILQLLGHLAQPNNTHDFWVEGSRDKQGMESLHLIASLDTKNTEYIQFLIATSLCIAKLES